MRDKPLNRNIRSAPLYLFDKVYVYSPFREINSWILIVLIVTSFTFIGKSLNKLKLDFRICSSQDITRTLFLVMTLALISFFYFFFTQHAITRISSRVSLYCIMIDQINELPEDGLKSSPETSRYIENTWFSRKIKISCTFLHLIDILNDLILIGLTDGSTGYERSLISFFFCKWR